MNQNEQQIAVSLALRQRGPASDVTATVAADFDVKLFFLRQKPKTPKV